MKGRIVNLMHILIVAPLLWAIGKNKIPEEYKKYLVYLAILIVLYHTYKLISHYINKKKRKINIIKKEHFGTINDCTRKDVSCIDIFDFNPGFSKPKIKININDIIVWKNVGELDHNVTSTISAVDMHPDNLFNSGYIKPGQQFAVQFKKPGTYHYYSIDNKGWMRGMIIVD